MSSRFQSHFEPYKEFVVNLTNHAEDFKTLSGHDNVKPSSIREFIKRRNYDLDDDARACRTTVAAFAAYMIDFHNCRVRGTGLFRKHLTLKHDSFNCDLFDLFYRVMFEGLEIPEEFKNKQMIEDQ